MSIELGNEFAQVRVSLVRTRNGARLLIESPKSGHAISLCPLELEALTWQGSATFSAMLGKPYQPLVDEPLLGELPLGESSVGELPVEEL